ncbi:C-1-tetrahydrofolate synthase [Rhizoctonia solani AG-3 Rhs1AP]|uniref:C-1-tetrahydrofolate synthase, cytoplasmic n=1 Tax=Rhizoctonia solani AG-3 Rhs1AP TaxID=1086054 RepID=X8JF27_9AGAM|nr:C-1-tetrahydrofolate synthase [Rhizoctonia solani AG-3 Rhs1AP]
MIMHRARGFSVRALDHRLTAQRTGLYLPTQAHRLLSLTRPALALVRSRGFGTRLLSESRISRMASSAAAAAIAEKPVSASVAAFAQAQSEGARIIDGTALAADIRSSVASRISALRAQNPRFQPHLAIVQAGSRPDSTAYIRSKTKACEGVGIKSTHVQLPGDASTQDVLDAVKKLNADDGISGVLVQLPIGDGNGIGAENERVVIENLGPEKDVDGFHPYNIGRLSSRASDPLFAPCTPSGVIKLIESTGVPVAGAHAVVLGRSDIVGNPVSAMLRKLDATVTQCHSRTRDLASILKTADIVVAAIGQPEFVRGDMLRPGCVVIDVGINYLPDESKKSGQRLVGDVHFESAAKVAGYITPVPGGVGPTTVALLMVNTLRSAEAIWAKERERRVTPLPLDIKQAVPSDIEIAMAQTPKDVAVLAKEIGIRETELESYGRYKAKVELSILDRLAHRKNGKYVVVSGITPTPLGEGKSTTTVGLVQALGAHLGRPAFACVRQPSQGPTFGIKGGAAGGGYSQVFPMDEFNLHLTGDIHAVTAANNLLAAALDARIFHEATTPDKSLYNRLVPPKKGVRTFAPLMLKRLEKLGITSTSPDELTPEEARKFSRLDVDMDTITWNRVLDVNDRFLRKITVGQNPTEQGHSRETGFDIAVASECMAVLALSNSLADMRERLGRMVVATSKGGDPITADDVGVGGALAVLMKDSIKPNLMQTLEGTPVFVHAGPFANIAHGNSSILADRVALKLAGTEEGDSPEREGYVLTEGGFGADMGMEKFCNIKCRISGLVPDATVIVATTRALKMHGGAPDVTPGKPLHDTYLQEDLVTLKEGCKNLGKHIQNAKAFGVKVVVAVNQFATDTAAELELVKNEALTFGADAAVVSNHWAKGGAGARDLAEALIQVCESGEPDFKFTYDLNLPIAEKINAIATKVYGADGIELSELAAKQIATYEAQGFGNLPICMAKTQYSFSHDPKLKGVPTGFTVPIRAVRLSAGAGFLYPLLGDMQTMPGLGTRPGFWEVGLDEKGQVIGLF